MQGDNEAGGEHYGPGEITDRARQLERVLAAYNGTDIPAGTITAVRVPKHTPDGRGGEASGGAAAPEVKQGVLGRQTGVAKSVAKVFGKKVVFFHSSDPE